MDNDLSAGEFISGIMQTLTKNGYPEKKVALPLDKMYEVAHEKGANFNKVLEFLREKGIDHSKTTEKIVFFPVAEAKEEVSDEANDPSSEKGGFGAGFPGLPGMDPSALKNMNMSDMMKTATDLMKNMSPEQMAAVKDQISNLTPDQIRGMQNMFGGLSDDEKANLAEKAKGFLGKK